MFESWIIRHSKSALRRLGAVRRIEKRARQTTADLIVLIRALGDDDERVSAAASAVLPYVGDRVDRDAVGRRRDTLLDLLLNVRVRSDRAGATRDNLLVRLGDKRAIPHLLARADSLQLSRLDQIDRNWRQSEAFDARIQKDIANLANAPRERSSLNDQGPWAASVVERLNALDPAWTERSEAKAAIPFLIWHAHHGRVWDALQKLDPQWPDNRGAEFPRIIHSYLEQQEEIRKNPSAERRDDWLVRRALRAMGDERAIPHYQRFIRHEVGEAAETALALRRVAGQDQSFAILKQMLAELVDAGAAHAPWILNVAAAIRAIDERRAAPDVAAVLPPWTWHWGGSGWSGGAGHFSYPSNFEERRDRIADEIVVWLWEVESVRAIKAFAAALERHCSRDDCNYGFGATVATLVSALDVAEVRASVDRESLEVLATLPDPAYTARDRVPTDSKGVKLMQHQPMFERVRILAREEIDRRGAAGLHHS